MDDTMKIKILEAIHKYPHKQQFHDNSSLEFIPYIQRETEVDDLAQLEVYVFALLRELASYDYNGYLNTDHWKQLSARKKREVNYTCELCLSKQDIDTHHKTYIRVGRELLSDLSIICNPCHYKLHNK
jgi:hypothetical protein